LMGCQYRTASAYEQSLAQCTPLHIPLTCALIVL
jgi:hypothetical protein